MAETETQPQVLIVGGNLRQLESSFIKKLEEEAQLKFSWHWETLSPQTNNIPQKCALVVLIKDQISHTFHGKVVNQARKRDLPCISVSRKWSKAAPVLRAKGFLKPSKNRHVVRQEDVVLVAETLISDTLLRGKHPLMDVVNKELVRAFGNKGALTGSLYTELLCKASENSPPTGVIKAAPVEAAPVEAAPVERTPEEVLKEVAQWAQILLTEHPSYLLNRRALLERIRQEAQIRGDLEPPLYKIMTEAMRTLRINWESKTEKELEAWLRSTRTHDEAPWSDSRVATVSKTLCPFWPAQMVKKLPLKDSPPKKRKPSRQTKSLEPDMFFKDYPGFLAKWWAEFQDTPVTAWTLYRLAHEDPKFEARRVEQWLTLRTARVWLTRVLTNQEGVSRGDLTLHIKAPEKPLSRPARLYFLENTALEAQKPKKQPRKQSPKDPQRVAVTRQLIQNWARKYGRQKIEFKHLIQLLDEMNLDNYKRYSSRGMRTVAGKLLTQTASGIEGLKIWKKREGHASILHYALEAIPSEWGVLQDAPATTWYEPERISREIWDDPVTEEKTSVQKTPQTEEEHLLEGLRIVVDHHAEFVQLIQGARDAQEVPTTLMDRFALSEAQAEAILRLRLPELPKPPVAQKKRPPLVARLKANYGSFKPEEGLLEVLSVPYGWMISEDRKALVEDPETQDVRARIESLAQLGVSAMAILLVMETDNPTYRGRPWTMDNVTQILEASHE